MGRSSRYSKLQKNGFIEEWMTSGQTRSFYCKSKKISFETFGNWVSEYRKERNVASKVRTRDLAPHFMSVEMTDQEQDQTEIVQQVAETGFSLLSVESFSNIQITYPTGTSLKIGSQVGLEQLRTLLNLI